MIRPASIAAIAVLALCAGCEKTARNMYDQPRDKPLAASALWSDSRSAREPVAGTQARSAGTRADTSSGRLGRVTPEAPVARAAWTLPTLVRGRERYDIFCAPCHSAAGDGDGMIARRGFPHPPSFHIERLRDAPDAHFLAVIRDGYGAMYPYANRIADDDRIAIVGYIRALQLSQHAALGELPPQDRARLEALP